MNPKTVAMEVIHYQKDASFFKELTSVLATIRENADALGQLGLFDFYQHPKVAAILSCVNKHTDITMVFKGNESNFGPAIITPGITKNHIFDLMWNPPDTGTSVYDKGALRYFDEMKQASKAFIGEVNIRTGKVGGAFKDIPILLAIPSQLLLNVANWAKVGLTSEELAAIVMHEVGHASSYFEYLDRVVTTNRVLSAIAFANTNKDQESKKIIVAKSAKDLAIAPADIDQLLNSDDNMLTAVILVNSAKNKSISELGVSIYDCTGCEQLADQYTNRMGAGKHLVIGLDKVYRYTGVYSGMSVMSFMFDVLFLPITAVVYTTLFFTTLLAMSVDNGYERIYDDPKTRFLRVKHDLVNRLKNPRITSQERDMILGDIQVIDNVIDNTKPEVLSLVTRVANMLYANRKKSLESELLQKELEAFANNNFFIHAAKIQQALK